MDHELQWSQHVARWSHLAAFLQIAQGNLGWYGPGLGLRSPACIRIKMAKHVGCFCSVSMRTFGYFNISDHNKHNANGSH